MIIPVLNFYLSQVLPRSVYRSRMIHNDGSLYDTGKVSRKRSDENLNLKTGLFRGFFWLKTVVILIYWTSKNNNSKDPTAFERFYFVGVFDRKKEIIFEFHEQGSTIDPCPLLLLFSNLYLKIFRIIAKGPEVGLQKNHEQNRRVRICNTVNSLWLLSEEF